MVTPTFSARLALAGACGLLLVGGIAGAATVDGDDGKAPPNEALASDDTTPLPASSAPGQVPEVAPVPGAPEAGTTATTAAATTTAAPGAATTATTAARAGRSATPGALVAPKVGDYGYEATTTSPGGTRTERTTTRVEAAGTEGATTIQAITIPLDLGGMQAVARNTVAWSASGALVRRSLITVSGIQAQLDCGWQPAFPQYVGGLAVGRAWSFDTRCTGKVQGFDVTIEQRAVRKVTGTAMVTGPGGSLATWTIADDTTVSVQSPLGAGSVRTVGTQQLAPALGLPVRTQLTVESRMAGSPPEQSTATTTLLTRP